MGPYRTMSLLLAVAWPLAASAYRHISALDVPGAKVMTQSQMIAEFGKFLKSGPVYKKITTVRARKAVKGEQIVTIVDGKEETTNTASEGDMVVLNSGADGEAMLLTAGDFADRYDPASRDDTDAQGFRTYTPKGRVQAMVATAAVVEKLRVGRSNIFEFLAPWGEKMMVEPGDVLVMPYPKSDQVYRIALSAFERTYRLSSD